MAPLALLLALAASVAVQASMPLGPELRVLRPAGRPAAAALEEGELQLATDDSLELRCDGVAGPQGLRWSFPEPDPLEVLNPPLPAVEQKSVGNGRWSSVLSLPNASYFHTGLYSCAPAPDDPNDVAGGATNAPPLPPGVAPPGAAALYVYVSDPETPWVRALMETVFARQKEEAVLDCRPNNRSLHVRLFNMQSREVPPAGAALYDPRRGFSLRGPLTARLGEEMFECLATAPGPEGAREERLSLDEAEARAVGPPLITAMLVVPRNTEIVAFKIHAVGAVPHAVLGDAVELRCSVHVANNALFKMKWRVPEASRAAAEGRLSESNTTVHFESSMRVGTTNLTLTNVKDTDAGDYFCVVSDHNESLNTSFRLEIKDGSVTYIDVWTEDDEELHQRTQQGGNATWALRVVTFPPWPTLSWFGPDGRQLGGAKYLLHSRPQGAGLEVLLSVGNTDLRDRGVYTLKVNTPLEERLLNLTLEVIAPPVVQLHAPVEPVHVGAEVRLQCRVSGWPLPGVEWAWRPCPGGLLRRCSPDGPPSAWTTLPGDTLAAVSDVEVNASLRFKPATSGHVVCSAANKNDGIVRMMDEDEVNDTAPLQVTDLPEPASLVAWGPELAVEGDVLELWCGALRENHTTWPRWQRRQRQGRQLPLPADDRVQIQSKNTTLSMRTVLRIARAHADDYGRYECAADPDDDIAALTASYYLDVKPEQRPFPRGPTLNNSDLAVTAGQKLRLDCNFEGLPPPVITWFKDGRPLDLPAPHPAEGDAESQFRLENNNRTLRATFVTEADAGEYRCRAANRVAVEERLARVAVAPVAGRQRLTGGMVALVVLLVLLIIIVVPLAIWLYREKKRHRLVVKNMGNFEEGQPDVLNPALPPDDQAELLPYDKKWEFPRERLDLGKQLGSGAFGVVLKAKARGIVEGEAETTVAVKMVKRTAQFAYLRALASELKIMVHLGRHLNVVNLLGACTGQLVRHELLVIVEYCRFGNLHNYLQRHRAGFLDQVDPATGALTQGADAFAQAMALARARDASFSVKYTSLSFPGSAENSACTGASEALTASTSLGDASASAAGPCFPPPVDYRAVQAQADAHACEGSAGREAISMAPIGADANEGATSGGAMSDEDYGLSSSGSAQPHWRSNYHGDYRGEHRICTRDLLCWAYQVARGMQYLAGRKVLHGDLAARNILLAEGNVVKICDFGLAKSMYKSDNYKKKGDGPLPVKWMALESIRDGIFSTQSDVWSFGVVLWELFSLAQTPYPGMVADERLYSKLQAGYRMERPRYAPSHLYVVMERCWAADPSARPLFDELVEELGGCLEDSVRNHYLDLNNAYMDMNEQWQRDGATDYLDQLAAPDYYNMITPRDDDADDDYIQNVATPPSPGYLPMRGGNGVAALGASPAMSSAQGSTPATPLSAKLFSPRPDGAQVFTFAAAPAPELCAVRPKQPYVNVAVGNGHGAHAVDAFYNPSYVGRFG